MEESIGQLLASLVRTIWKRTGYIDSAGSYEGLMDEFTIFDRALSEKEIAAIYQRQAGG